MAALVTLDDAKLRLHIDFSEGDSDFDSMADEATDIVIGYIKKPNHGWTTETVPPRIRSAILMVVARLDASRSGELEGGVLNQAVKDILHRDRDPALA